MLQPVIVRPVEDGYELVAGERRWRAAELAGEATIPALVDDALDQAGSLELALIENIVREDLSPIEQARTFSVLLDDLRMTSVVLARRIGRSRADIANTVRLLDLPDEVVEMIDYGRTHQGSRQGAADRARPSPPASCSRGRRRSVAGRCARSRARSPGRRSRPLRVRLRIPISVPSRPGSRRRSRERSDARPRPSRTAAGSRSCSTTPPPIASLARSAPTWGHCDAGSAEGGRRAFHVEHQRSRCIR